MKITQEISSMAHYVAFATSRRSSLDIDDVEQECLLLAWQAKDDMPLALLRCAMNRQAGMMMRSASRKSRVRSVSNDVLDKHYTPGCESDVIAQDFADAFAATLTGKMQEACEAIRETSTLEEAAKLCGVSSNALRQTKFKIHEKIRELTGER
jgi:DNA-directed RNA polymerase specialized sigma24 family protein